MTHKRLAELSLKRRMDASRVRLQARGRGPDTVLDRQLAKMIDEEAEDIIATDEPSITNMGEVTTPRIEGLKGRHWIKETLIDGDLVAEEASITRTGLLVQPNLDISALAVDAADSINADNSMEKMLAHQMALAHEMVMKIGNAAMGEVWKIQVQTNNGSPLTPGAATELQRLTNSVARLMGAYQAGMLTLQRIKTGGNQVVTVQHVNVSDGGQAVIGNVQAGGGRLPGDQSKDG